MITLNSLSKIYRTDEIETVALENVNLTVERGEFLSIMGPSGCGKTTTLRVIGGLKGIDLSDCTIERIILSDSFRELKGATINSVQAADLIRLLGVKVV